MLEEDIELDVSILENTFVKGILGTTLPPNKNQKLIKISDASVDNYDMLVLPGGLKLWRKSGKAKT